MTMDAIGGLFSSGRVVDLILAVLAVEIAATTVWQTRAGKPSPLASLLIAALPGMCLLLALRAALTGAGWPWIALWLTVSFPAHLADLRRRPP